MTQPPSPDQPQPPQAAHAAGAAPDLHVPQAPAPAYGAPPQPYGAPPQPYGAPAQPYTAPPQAYGAPPAYDGARDPYAAQQPPPPAGYGQPQQPGYQAYVSTPPGAPPPYGAPPSPYAAPPAPPAPPAYPAYPTAVFEPPPREPIVPVGLPPLRDRGSKRPSGWNAYSIGLLAIVVVAVGMLVWPQFRARSTERAARPLVSALSQRDAGARCPRYITSVLTNVGSVSLDGSGNIADHTDLTGPVCNGLRHLYSSGGKAELACLTAAQPACKESARRSVVALSVVAHESMHLRGQLDEGRAECESIGESQTLATTLGIPLDQARMISWLHYASLNPYTPPQYHVTPENCKPVAELLVDLPGAPEAREALRVQVSNTWRDLAT